MIRGLSLGRNCRSRARRITDSTQVVHRTGRMKNKDSTGRMENKGRMGRMGKMGKLGKTGRMKNKDSMGRMENMESNPDIWVGLYQRIVKLKFRTHFLARLL